MSKNKNPLGAPSSFEAFQAGAEARALGGGEAPSTLRRESLIKARLAEAGMYNPKLDERTPTLEI